MALTETARLKLAKQDAGDPSWGALLNTGFDNADARLLKNSQDYANVSDPNSAVVGDFRSQLYFDNTLNPPRIWICLASGTSNWKLLNSDGIRTPSAILGQFVLSSVLSEIVALLPTTGDLRPTYKNAAPAGWLMLTTDVDVRTLGDSLSGADINNSEVEALFKLLWNNVADAYCPVFSGRGASADADWSNHKTLRLPRFQGRSPMAAGLGFGFSTTWNLGEFAGEETHALTVGELPAHTHTVPPGDNTPGTGTLARVASNSGGGSITTSSVGSGTPHNVVHPVAVVHWMVKL